eukprot:1066788-Pelagomonas_calceolata.AAC.1
MGMWSLRGTCAQVDCCEGARIGRCACVLICTWMRFSSTTGRALRAAARLSVSTVYFAVNFNN